LNSKLETRTLATLLAYTPHSPGYSPGAAAPTLVVLESSPCVERVVMQLIGLVEYTSLKKFIW